MDKHPQLLHSREACKAVVGSSGLSIAKQLCEIQMQCEADKHGVMLPEGKGYTRQLNACIALTKIGINDYSRPQARKCIAEAPSAGCEAFEACVAPPDFDDDF